MQSTITIQYPEDLKKAIGSELMLGLQQEIQLHKQQLGYMVQDYYPKQKVRVADLIFESSASLEFLVHFSLEEFSSCAAIDTYDLSEMKVTVKVSPDKKEIVMEGEAWAG